MQYMDEKILKFIRDAEKMLNIKNICEEPVKIGKRYYEFEEQGFYEDKLKMYIPKDFQDMPEESKKLKYPSENRPEIIKSNMEGNIAITLSALDNPILEEQVESLTKETRDFIRRMSPSNVFYQDGIEKVGNKTIGFFDFKSSAIDDFIYNFMFIFEFENKSVLGTFSCLHKQCEEWREYVFQMIKTIKVIKGDE